MASHFEFHAGVRNYIEHRAPQVMKCITSASSTELRDRCRYSRFQEEHQRRLHSDEEVATLRESNKKLEARLHSLEHQVGGTGALG